MNIAFTGTRKGMSNRQKLTLTYLISSLYYSKGILCFTHGGAIGADTDADEIINKLGYKPYIRPGSDERFSYWFIKKRRSNVYGAKLYLQRNKDIVNDSEILIACPYTLTEEQRSGTWATIRYARKINKPIIILDP